MTPRSRASYGRPELGPYHPQCCVPRPRPDQMVGTDHAILRCGRDPSLLGGRDHGPSGPKRPSASMGTPLLERGMCVKTRHLWCVRVSRTHPYRGGIKVFRDESHEFVRAVPQCRTCVSSRRSSRYQESQWVITVPGACRRYKNPTTATAMRQRQSHCETKRAPRRKQETA